MVKNDQNLGFAPYFDAKKSKKLRFLRFVAFICGVCPAFLGLFVFGFEHKVDNVCFCVIILCVN